MDLSSLIRMSWSNLWRHRRRTLITACSIAFACLLATIMIGMNDQSWENVINTAARIGGGHITIQHPDYQDKPATSRTVQGVAPKLARIRALPGVSHAVPRIVLEALLSTATESQGAAFVAYDPGQETPQTLSMLDALDSGAHFRTTEDGGIILGWRLARNLNARLGTKLVYTVTAKDGEIVTGLARVTGLIRTGSPAVDLSLAFLPLGVARKVLRYGPTEAGQIAVFLKSQRRSAALQTSVEAQIMDGSAVLTWKQTQPDLDSFIALKKGGGAFFSILILLLCAAGIFNTLFVSVMERLREFGIMMAVGLSPNQLFALVMLESLWLGVLGIALGAGITAWPYYYLSTTGLDLTEVYGRSPESAEIAGIGMDMVMRVGLYPESAGSIVIAAMSATLLAGLYPAWKAAKVNPVEAVKLV